LYCVQIMIPKPDGGQRGIGLLEIIFKVFECIIDARVKAKVKFHDCLHGFRAARGTDTAQIESKLFQQLAGIDQETLFKGYLDWFKAFDSFHKVRAFKKLHEYGFPPKMLGLIAVIWDQIIVLPKQADYYGYPFTPGAGQITGSILGPLIFNIIVDSIVRYWLTIMVDDGGTSAISGLTVKDILILFYADDGMIAARDPAWLQEALEVLVALFRRAGLDVNVNKTKIMICHPGFIKTHFSDATYKRRLTGEGPSPQQLKKVVVECPNCKKKMNKASLASHMERAHGEPLMVIPELPAAFRRSHQPTAYTIEWPRVHKKWPCPVEGCPYQASTNANFHNHFMYRHPYDSIHITDESTAPWPKCSLCGLQTPFPTFRSHTESETCIRGRITQRSREIANDILQNSEQTFTIDGTTIESVGSFRYLGKVETRSDSDWAALYTNLKRARYKWYKLSKLLHREGANSRIFGMFYKAVVQTVLLFGCESWTMTDAMWTVLRGFHHRAARRMANMMAYRTAGGKWVYPPIEEALKKAGLYNIEHYVNKRQYRIVDYIASRPIWAHCMAATKKPGTPAKTVYWWNQNRTPPQAKSGRKKKSGMPAEAETWEDGTPCL
jgi:Reverse transcriptase (RNA-dependent DNA polymerase)